MAPTLFALYFAVMLKDALQSSSSQIVLNTRTDGGIFNLSRFRAKGKVRQRPVLEILYADDIYIMADSMSNLRQYMEDLEKRVNGLD